ncbi:carbonic anhydrase 14 [Ambystoma mexicanum]|uniref:carbonic anhydrase 14 n=1 Tax=Ambystoma mexicanum TaxID=8296 RepID=UPI0037E6FEDD
MPPAATGLSHRMLALLVLWQAIFWVPARSDGSQWTYAGPHGQDQWPDTFPDCGGTAQSPINIQFSDVQYNDSLPPIQPEGYRRPVSPAFTLTNNGHTVEMSLPESMFLRGLPKRYSAVQLHLHWGSRDHPGGSEHQLNGEPFPAELHIVHFNSERYANLSQAKNKPDGLAVLGILIEAGETVNKAYDKILNFLENVTHEGDKVLIPSFDVHQLLPETLDQFFRYRGSLTTPPCHQSVLWTVFHQRVQLSGSQLEKLQRGLYSTEPGISPMTIVDNFRVVQMLNQRTVYSSFPVDSMFTYSAGVVVAIVFGILFGFLGLFVTAHIIVKKIRANSRNGQKEVVLKSSSTLPPEPDASANI